MNETNYIKLEFPSKSCNEAFARTAAAAFAAVNLSILFYQSAAVNAAV